MAQGSAQATMRVSVEVVEAASVETEAPAKLNLASNTALELGSIKLTGVGSDQTYIQTGETLELHDKEGNRIDISINSEIKESDSSVSKVALWGSPSQHMKSGAYSGKLSTTIEYH